MRRAIEASRLRCERISIGSDSAETVDTRSVKMMRGIGFGSTRLFDCQASEDSYKMWEAQQLGLRPDAAQLVNGQSYQHPKHRRNRVSVASSRDDSSSPHGPVLPIDVEKNLTVEDREIHVRSPVLSSAISSEPAGISTRSHVVRADDLDKENVEMNSVEDFMALPLKERLQAKRRKSLPARTVDEIDDSDAGGGAAQAQTKSREGSRITIELDARPDSRNKSRAKQQSKETSLQNKVCGDEDVVQALRRKLEEANRAREEASEKQRVLEREAAEKERALQAAQKAKEKEAAEKRKREKAAEEAAKRLKAKEHELQKKLAIEQEARERAEEELKREKELAAAERKNKELREKLALEQQAREKAEEELRRRKEQAREKAAEELRRRKEQEAQQKAEEELRRRKEQDREKAEEELRRRKDREAREKAEEELNRRKEQNEQDRKRRRKSGNFCSEEQPVEAKSARCSLPKKEDAPNKSIQSFFKKQDVSSENDNDQLSSELKTLPLKERLMRMRSASADTFDASPKIDPSTSSSAPSHTVLSTSREGSVSSSAKNISRADIHSHSPPMVEKKQLGDDEMPLGKGRKSNASRQKEQQPVEKPRMGSSFSSTPLRVKGAASKPRGKGRGKDKKVDSQSVGKKAAVVEDAVGAASRVSTFGMSAESVPSKDMAAGIKRPLPKETAQKPAASNKASPRNQSNKTSPKMEPSKASSPNVPPAKKEADDGMSLGSLLESSIPGWQGARLRAGRSGVAARLGLSPGVRRWPLSRKPSNADPKKQPTPAAQPPKPALKLPEEKFAPPPENMNERESAAYSEVLRILQVRKESYKSPSAWGCAVLNVQSTDLAGVQQGYRKLMQKLHPDKVGHLPHIERAVAVTREAKELCERTMSRQVPPGVPRNLRTATLCGTKGKRRFKLSWEPPTENDSAPVQRYLINAFDPAYGKALTITILEPDYSEELRRYVRLEELTNFMLSEQELTKMPSLFEQRVATLQVAAANDSGTGPWASVKVRMSG